MQTLTILTGVLCNKIYIELSYSVSSYRFLYSVTFKTVDEEKSQGHVRNS